VGSIRKRYFKTEDVKLLCELKFGEMGETEFRSVCDHAKRIKRQYLETEGIIDLEADTLTISLGGQC
jgi:hypothetical protein